MVIISDYSLLNMDIIATTNTNFISLNATNMVSFIMLYMCYNKSIYMS
jgi:hypothetical protein